MLEAPGKNKKLREKYADVVPHLENLYALYKILHQARAARGAIDFDTTETRIVFGKDRKIEKIVPLVRNDAHKLIEECMLSANVAAARFLEAHGLVGLYRVHERPRAEKIADLRDFLGEFGLELTGEDEPTTLDYQLLLKKAQARPEIHLIQMVMLRSMMQAVYSPNNKGHFGLNYDEYAHFTSPIRRYPDLLVHRAIRSIIRSKVQTDLVQRVRGAKLLDTKEIYPYNAATMAMLGEHCSMTERRADEATREAVSWLKCEYIQDRIGETFDGVITAATGFGIFVELKDIYVEGLVHVTSLANDYYHYEAAKHRLVGEQTRTMYRLGDHVRVTVVRVDLETRKVDFELADVVVGRKQQKRNAKEVASKKEEKPSKPGHVSKQGQPTALIKKPKVKKESVMGKIKSKIKKHAKKIKDNKNKAKGSGAKASHAGPSDPPALNIRKRTKTD
jgi:ribonuclease R